MTAQLVRLDDYRPPPIGVASLWLNAMFHLSLGMTLAMVASLTVFMRGPIK